MPTATETEHEPTLEDRVRGTNPNTGAQGGLVERVAADTVCGNLALALRAMPVGSFQAINGDLRSVEASCKAAEALMELFHEHGLTFAKYTPPKEDTESDTPEATSGRSHKN